MFWHDFLGGFGGLGEGLGGFRRDRGRPEQAMGRFDCVLYASWECLGASWERLVGFESALKPTLAVFEGFERRSRVPKAGACLVFKGSRRVSAWFFRVISRWRAKMGN